MTNVIDARQRFYDKMEHDSEVVDASDRFAGRHPVGSDVVVDARDRFAGIVRPTDNVIDATDRFPDAGEAADRVVLDAVVRFAERRNAAIDAAERDGTVAVPQGEFVFQLRREANDLFSMDFDVLKFVHERMAKETEYYLEAIDSQSEPIADYLKSRMENGLTARLTPDFVYEMDPEDLEFGEAKREDHFGVFEQKGDDDQVKTLVYIPLETIYDLYNRVRTFRMFPPEDIRPETDDKQSLEAAVAMATWATLGKWTIEQLDPRRKVMLETSATRIASNIVIRNITGENIDDEFERYEDTVLGGEMYRITNEFAGKMAYAGLDRFFLDKRSEMYGHTGSMVHSANSWLQDVGYKNPEEVGQLDLMLARPMSNSGVASTLEVLEPMAEALLRKDNPKPPTPRGPRGPRGGLKLVA